MNKEIIVDKWTTNLLQKAIELAKNVYGEAVLTTDLMLFTMLTNKKSMLVKYMLDEGLFKIYFGDEYPEVNVEDVDKACYSATIETIVQFYGIAFSYYSEYMSYFEIECDESSNMTWDSTVLLIKAQEIAESKGLSKVDEESLTIALVQSENVIWYTLARVLDEDNYVLENLRKRFHCEDLGVSLGLAA